MKSRSTCGRFLSARLYERKTYVIERSFLMNATFYWAHDILAQFLLIRKI